MFKKILIANRGEIAVRVIRACQELGIVTAAVYQPADITSLHVRLADECYPLQTPPLRPDASEHVRLALEIGADAIHPGYGFMAERADFVKMCDEAGVRVIGPDFVSLGRTTQKVSMLEEARAAGIPTVQFSDSEFDSRDVASIRQAAEAMGYPVVVRASIGGRGRGTVLVRQPESLNAAVRRARAEAMVVYGNSRLYLEKALDPALHLDVQILADDYGHIIHLGERCSSLEQHSQKLIAESPAPCIDDEQRQRLLAMAVEIARLFEYRNSGSVEFVLDSEGRILFSDFKPRIQVQHSVSEEVTGIDIVQAQIRLAAGERLAWQQGDIHFFGNAMQVRLNAQDPWNNYLPSPGHLRRFRLASGPGVRVETHAQTGSDISVHFDPIMAKLIVWAEDRAGVIARMQRALTEFVIQGIPTNVPLLQGILHHPDFIAGDYSIDYFYQTLLNQPVSDQAMRDLAVAAAVAYLRRTEALQPVLPSRLQSGWHRSSRQMGR